MISCPSCTSEGRKPIKLLHLYSEPKTRQTRAAHPPSGQTPRRRRSFLVPAPAPEVTRPHRDHVTIFDIPGPLDYTHARPTAQSFLPPPTAGFPLHHANSDASFAPVDASSVIQRPRAQSQIAMGEIPIHHSTTPLYTPQSYPPQTHPPQTHPSQTYPIFAPSFPSFASAPTPGEVGRSSPYAYDPTYPFTDYPSTSSTSSTSSAVPTPKYLSHRFNSGYQPILASPSFSRPTSSPPTGFAPNLYSQPSAASFAYPSTNPLPTQDFTPSGLPYTTHTSPFSIHQQLFPPPPLAFPNQLPSTVYYSSPPPPMDFSTTTSPGFLDRVAESMIDYEAKVKRKRQQEGGE